MDMEKQIAYTQELIELDPERQKKKEKIRIQKEKNEPLLKLAEKLLNREIITKADIQSLGMYGDKYIDMLLKTPQAHVRKKLAEVLAHMMR